MPERPHEDPSPAMVIVYCFVILADVCAAVGLVVYCACGGTP